MLQTLFSSSKKDFNYQDYLKQKSRHKRWGKYLLGIVLVLFLVLLLLFFYQKLTNIQTETFDAKSGPIVNPLMGWAPWATIDESQQPHTLVFADLTWRDFEPEEGKYDFKSFEEKHQLDRWRSEGKRVVFRFIMDKPGDEAHSDIPDWLIAKIAGAGSRYENGYGSGFSPDYTHPALIEGHRKAIQMLGSRYGSSSFFAYIELGSLGHWGEWHVDTDAGIDPLPEPQIRDMYVKHYLDYFPDTHLLMRRPFSIAKEYDLGLYNDLTGDPEGTEKWLNWIARGDEDSQPGEENDLAAMPDGWQRAPIGGEQTSLLSISDLYDNNLDRTIKLLKDSHATFIGPKSPYKISADDPLQKNLDLVLSSLGYRIYVLRASFPKFIRYQREFVLQITIGNQGNAPIYYNWPVRLYITDDKGRIYQTNEADIDISKILPGEQHDISVKIPTSNLKKGVYTINLGIVDPLTDQPAVRLAIEDSNDDFLYKLGDIRVKHSLRKLILPSR